MSTPINTYDYLYNRAEYPMERGYKVEPVKLPSWIHITVTEDDADTKWVDVHSRIHLNKVVRLPTAYSSQFSDKQILKDISEEVARRFL